MPYVVNGIGTWYWGKDNLRVSREVCPECGRLGDLKSYDTRTYFVVLFIPVFPLGRKRVLNQCPTCRKHLAIKYADWQRGLERDLVESVQAVESTPNDLAAVKRALGMTVFYQEDKHLRRIAAACQSFPRRSLEIQLLLAGAYEFFGRHREAEPIYRACLETDPGFGPREALARNLLLQNRPDEAWELLSHVIVENRREGYGLLLLTAESYQTWGMHGAALDVLDACVRTFPELRHDADFRRIEKSAQKHKFSSKPVRSKLLTSLSSSAVGGRRFTSRVPRIIATAVLCLLACCFVYYSREIASARPVYVVNGLSAPYDVLLNDRRVTVPARGFQCLHIPEGHMIVTVEGEGITVPPQEGRISTNFFSRPFTDPIFVLNPDRAALIAREETQYTVGGVGATPSKMKYFCGELLMSFDADYAFQEFPNSIPMTSSGPILKSRVTSLSDYSAETTAGILASEWNLETARDWVRRRAQADADDFAIAGLVLALLESGEALRILDELRSRRPLRVEAHRAYQQLVDLADPQRDMAAEYRALLAEAPDDPVLAYLLGRVLTDLAEAEALYTRGRGSSPPCAHSLHALALGQLGRGDFEEALTLGEAALALQSDHPGFRWTRRLALEALGRFADAAADLRKDNFTESRIMREIYYLDRSGNHRELQNLLQEVKDSHTALGRIEEGNRIRASIDAILSYVHGDPQALVALDGPDIGSELRFASAVIREDWDAAAAALSPNGQGNGFFSLLLALLVQQSGPDAHAEQLLAVALAALQKDGSEGRKAAEWISGPARPEFEQVVRLPLPPAHKAILLTALGRRYPDVQERYFALARKLNFDQNFPHLSLEKLLE